jgi:hypothetical protein
MSDPVTQNSQRSAEEREMQRQVQARVNRCIEQAGGS